MLYTYIDFFIYVRICWKTKQNYQKSLIEEKLNLITKMYYVHISLSVYM